MLKDCFIAMRNENAGYSALSSPLWCILPLSCIALNLRYSQPRFQYLLPPEWFPVSDKNLIFVDFYVQKDKCLDTPRHFNPLSIPLPPPAVPTQEERRKEGRGVGGGEGNRGSTRQQKVVAGSEESWKSRRSMTVKCVSIICL